ncbi:hypothetical protein QJS66_15760 [Kocuria rhizophila]|nr:hypothetical protein QJS66_15760 [Kocuria rhizophila]
MPAINENVPLATATAGMAGGEAVAKGADREHRHLGTSRTTRRPWRSSRSDWTRSSGGRTIDAAGHRVVHGGERFWPRAGEQRDHPRHRAARSPWPRCTTPPTRWGRGPSRRPTRARPRGVRVRHRLPPVHAREGVALRDPHSWYEMDGMRRYGFHGTSHDYATGKGCEFLGIPREQFNAVVAHLGTAPPPPRSARAGPRHLHAGYTPLAAGRTGTRSGDRISAVTAVAAAQSRQLSGQRRSTGPQRQVRAAGHLRGPDMRAAAAAGVRYERAQLALDCWYGWPVHRWVPRGGGRVPPPSPRASERTPASSGPSRAIAGALASPWTPRYASSRTRRPASQRAGSAIEVRPGRGWTSRSDRQATGTGAGAREHLPTACWSRLPSCLRFWLKRRIAAHQAVDGNICSW